LDSSVLDLEYGLSHVSPESPLDAREASIPSIIDVGPGQFLVMQWISLYLAARVSLEGALKSAEEVLPRLRQKGQDEKPDKFDTIMTEFFGEIIDPEQTWNEIGISSTVSLELRDRLSESFLIELSPDCFELYPTPVALTGAYIEFVGDDTDSGRVCCVDANRLWKAALCYAFITTSAVVLAFPAFGVHSMCRKLTAG
jgi:acyl carrier protein